MLCVSTTQGHVASTCCQYGGISFSFYLRSPWGRLLSQLHSTNPFSPTHLAAIMTVAMNPNALRVVDIYKVEASIIEPCPFDCLLRYL